MLTVIITRSFFMGPISCSLHIYLLKSSNSICQRRSNDLAISFCLADVAAAALANSRLLTLTFKVRFAPIKLLRSN